MNIDIEASFEEIVTIGSKWWYIANLTYDNDQHVYPVVKIDGGRVYVSTGSSNTHSERIDEFLKKFTHARDIPPLPLLSVSYILAQAKQFGMSEEIRELLVEIDI